MRRDVEVAHAEREVDRVDVFERRGEERDVREREDGERASGDGHPTRGASTRRVTRPAQAQRLVQAPQAVALQVEAHVLIARAP